MTGSNIPRKRSRPYASAVRDRQAQHTRSAVIQAAGQCFAERGYAGTTMKDIAERAEVSVETVYGQGGKASLLIAAVDRVRTGGADLARVDDRTDMRAVLHAATPRDALLHLRTLITASLPDALPILSAFHRAADSDPEIATAYETYETTRWGDLEPIAQALKPQLRPEVSVDQAADVIWSLLDPTAAEGLVRRRGWTTDQWATWVTNTLDRLLLVEAAQT